MDGSWFHVDLLCPPVWNPTSTRLLEAEALTLCEASTRSVTEFVAAARCYWLKVHSSSLPFDSGTADNYTKLWNVAPANLLFLFDAWDIVHVR